MSGTTNAAAGGSSGTVNASNKLSAAMFELRKYYAMTGRGDLIQIIAEISPEITPEQAAEQGIEAIEAVQQTLEERIPPDVIEQLMFTLMDNTEGAYFTKDLISDTGLLSRFSISSGISSGVDAATGDATDDYTGINNYVTILMEPQGEFGVPGSPGDLPFWLSTVIEPPSEPVEGASDEDKERASISSLVGIKPNPKYPDSTAQDNSAEGPGFALNSNVLDPDRFVSPTLSVFLFPNQKLSPAMRGTSATSLFVNAIPSVEMSRCIPYINVSFVSAVPPALGKRTNQISLLRFLGMSGIESEADGKNPYDKIGLENALPSKLKEEFGFTLVETSAEETTEEYSTAISSAGMELFTAPQTLVNPNINQAGFTGASGTALDVFAPFMTLQALKIRISGLGNALHSNKTGNLSFVLHDRSRMADIAPLIATDLFAQSYLTVEWGWSHPDGDDASTNAYGALLNSMRSVGQFNIVASNFSLGNDGQVTVDMKIASRGGSEIRSFPIATGRVMPVGPFKSIVAQYLAEALQNAKSEKESSDSDTLKEIRSKINVKMDIASAPGSVITRDLWDQFMMYIRPANAASKISPADFIAAVALLVGDPTVEGETGQIMTGNASLAAEVDRKFKQVKATNDPFYPSTLHPAITNSKKTDPNANYQSLGKIITQFVGVPLAGCGRFDEVQLMFYRFNGKSGAAREYDTIASFLVKDDVLRDTLTEYTEKRPSMSIEGYMNVLNDKVVGDSASINYGLTALQAELEALTDESDQARDTKEKIAAAQTEAKVISDKVTKQLESIYATGTPTEPVFVIPKLAMIFEALPALVAGEDEEGNPLPFAPDKSKIVLRVHIFDTNATPHRDELFLHNAMNDKELAYRVKNATDLADAESANAANPPAAPKPKGDSSKNVDFAIENSMIASPGDPDSDEFQKSPFVTSVSNFPNTELKRIIKASVPSMTFGLGFSALNSFTMQSTTGGATGDVLLLNAIASTERAASAGESENKTNDLEDVTVIPANASMDLLGCPLLEYGQNFFVDLGTGTTADNLYYITAIEHTLTSGEFRTSATLSFSGSGTLKTFRSMLVASQAALSQIAADAESESDSG